MRGDEGHGEGGAGPRVAFLTTLGHNVGDDFIREGLRSVLDGVLPGYRPLYVNKVDKASLWTRVADEAEVVRDKYWESDLFVQSGAPVYWHLTAGRHRSVDAEWHGWAWVERILSSRKDGHPVFVNLGAGSGQPWGDDGTCFVEDPRCAEFARAVGVRAAVTTVRDRVAASILERLGVPHRLLPCPAFLASRRLGSGTETPEEVVPTIGVNLMYLGGHFALDNEFVLTEWQAACREMVAGLRKLGRLVFICHDLTERRWIGPLAEEGEQAFVAPDWAGCLEMYRSCSVVVANRVHGAVGAAGMGVPATIIGNDTRALIGLPLGMEVQRAAGVEPGAVVAWAERMLAERGAERERLLALRERTAGEYAEMLAPVAERVRAMGTRAPVAAFNAGGFDGAGGGVGGGAGEMLAEPKEGVGPRRAARKLAFISGCGRSGTTALGQLIGQHSDVRYVNDKFELWTRPFPFADIWTSVSGPTARVGLGAADANVPRAAAAWFRGQLEVEWGRVPVLVEKLAINNFRLGFIAALCPEALFINIVRNGIEVAYSIEERVRAGEWYGHNDRKWSLLVEYAWAHGYGKLVGLCRTPYERGLLEWRMSVEAAGEALAAVGPGRVLHVRYEELVSDAAGVGRRLEGFLGLEPSEAVAAFAAREVRRRSPVAAERGIPETTEAIAGPALRRLGYWPG